MDSQNYYSPFPKVTLNCQEPIGSMNWSLITSWSFIKKPGQCQIISKTYWSWMAYTFIFHVLTLSAHGFWFLLLDSPSWSGRLPASTLTCSFIFWSWSSWIKRPNHLLLSYIYIWGLIQTWMNHLVQLHSSVVLIFSRLYNPNVGYTDIEITLDFQWILSEV